MMIINSKIAVQTKVHKYTPKHDFNPMDCTDIVIGSARGNTHRIHDYYTRDRSTPRLDSFWGGKDSLTAVMGFEKDGVTTIAFRRPLSGDDHFTDHEIIDGAMQVSIILHLISCFYVVLDAIKWSLLTY